MTRDVDGFLKPLLEAASDFIEEFTPADDVRRYLGWEVDPYTGSRLIRASWRMPKRVFERLDGVSEEIPAKKRAVALKIPEEALMDAAHNEKCRGRSTKLLQLWLLNVGYGLVREGGPRTFHNIVENGACPVQDYCSLTKFDLAGELLDMVNGDLGPYVDFNEPAPAPENRLYRIRFSPFYKFSPPLPGGVIYNSGA